MAPIADVLHDFQLIRRAADLVMANHNDLERWHSHIPAVAQVTAWISADLCQTAAAAKATAEELRDASCRFRNQALQLRAARSNRVV
jgi:hypothetical protein